MKEIRKTSQFKKDYKRFKNDKEFVETLMGQLSFWQKAIRYRKNIILIL